VREVELHELLASLASYAVPERLAEVRTVLRVEVAERRRHPVAATARIADGAVEVLPGPDGPDPDVLLRARPDVVAGVVRGELNAGLEFLRGTLDIEGDTDHALAVGGMVRLAGTRDTPVDPRALDPVAVAGALGEVRGDHLRKVMRSGFRPVVLGEIFRRLPDFVNPRKAAKVHLVVGFRLTGNPSGEVERYVVTVDHGTARVEPVAAGAGETGDTGERHATITCEGHDFLKLATGHLNPVFGVLRGHLKVRGDQARALQLSSVLDIPQPA
jgi:putative sterol carrier protein